MRRVAGSMKARGRRPKLGSGTRFRNATSSLVAKGKSPQEAKRIMAWSGRRKYGKVRFQKLARGGRR